MKWVQLSMAGERVVLMVLADDALLAFARVFQEHFHCTWLAFVLPAHGDQPAYRKAVDFDRRPLCVQTSAVTVPQSGAARELYHRRSDFPPNLLRSLPADCSVYFRGRLEASGATVGLLEAAGRSGQADWTLEAFENWLALAAALLLPDNLHRRLEELNRAVPYLRDELRAGNDLRMLTGDSQEMRAVRLAIQQVAHTDSTVLIHGETGTGKELVARAIHQLSARRERLLVRVNCAALSPSIIASELFGHEAGAFTGATRRRIGRFELAHRGSLFLDEIAEINADVQVMLLRALQECTIERVGGNDPIEVDVRLIAATHQDLHVAIAEGRFRADLFYRLSVFPIHVPPLRARPGDISDLVRHFLHHFSRRLGKHVAHVRPDTLALLKAYPWPGNVRELENLIERAMIVTEGDTLQVDPAWLAIPTRRAIEQPTSLHSIERQSIIDALRRCRGRIYGPRGAARILGIKPTTLYGRMRKLGIDRDAE